VNTAGHENKSVFSELNLLPPGPDSLDLKTGFQFQKPKELISPKSSINQ